MAKKPLAILSFYDFGIMMRTADGDAQTEYAVSAEDVAAALASNLPEPEFNTGLIAETTIFVAEKGAARLVVDYRPPQKTGLYLEGSDTPVRVPLPGLLMIRKSVKNSVNYQVFAVLARPTKLDCALFNAPIPNVSSNGVCWGTVRKVSGDALKSNSLDEDWKVFLGSPFGNHTVNGKSKKYKQDIRKAYIAMDAAKTRRWPVKDLIATRETLGEVIDEAW